MAALTRAMILSYQAYGALAGVDPRMKGALLGGMVALFGTALRGRGTASGCRSLIRWSSSRFGR